MRSTPFSIEVLALIVVTLIPWPGPPVFRNNCSRDESNIVRKVIQSKWLPVLERFHVSLPLECPFHPLRDTFAPQHGAKLRHRPSQWTCAFCGKSFYEERWLDSHFDHRHKSQINKAEDAVCLADYCDIMRCGVVASQASWSTGGGGGAPGTDVEVWQGGPGAQGGRRALAPAAPRHLARVPRRRDRRATSAATSAAPPLTDCPKTEQATGPEPKPSEKAEEGDANQTSCCEPPAEAGEGGGVGAGAARLAAARAACDPAALHALKLRCEALVHACVAVTLLHLTDNQFQELEEEMQRAVCWYLSCDRYWQEAAPATRGFPWPLLLALATGLALAVCTCYYIVWLLFDSDEVSASGSACASLTSHSTPARAAADAAVDDPDHDDQYIYVTYPPELKRRLMESCYNRTTRL